MITKEILPIEWVEIEPGNFHFFLAVKIGRHKVRLLLDTGASKTAFDQSKIEKIAGTSKKDHPEIHSVGLGSSQVQTYMKELNSIKFGGIKLQKVEVAVLDLNHVNIAYDLLEIPHIDGVLGSDILVKLRAVINLEKMILTLKS